MVSRPAHSAVKETAFAWLHSSCGTYAQTGTQTDRQTDGCIDRQTDRQTQAQTRKTIKGKPLQAMQ